LYPLNGFNLAATYVNLLGSGTAETRHSPHAKIDFTDEFIKMVAFFDLNWTLRQGIA